jgi:hypothetical protein
MNASDDFNHTLNGAKGYGTFAKQLPKIREREEESEMKRKLMSLLVAMLFAAGTFILPVSVSAQGTAAQTTEAQGQKSTAKKSKKQTKAKKPSSSQKKKSTTTKKSPEQS